MKEFLSILLTFLFLLISPTVSAKNTDAASQSHLAILQNLVKTLHTYSDEASPDSVIKWVDEEAPQLRQDNVLELYFNLRRIQAKAYILRSDFGLSIECARNMYEESRLLRYKLGEALAQMTLGENYIYGNSWQMAANAYENAEALLKHLSRSDRYKKTVTILQASLFMNRKDFKQSDFYIQQIRQYLEDEDPASPMAFYFHEALATYDLTLTTDTDRSHLDDAFYNIRQMLAQVEKLNDNPWRFNVKTVLVGYYMCKGSEDASFYDKAKEELTELLAMSEDPQFTTFRINVLSNLIDYDRSLGKYEAGCQRYEKLIAEIDSLSSMAYYNQRVSLDEHYALKYEDDRTYKIKRAVLYGCSGVAFLVLLISLFIFFRIYLQQKGLRKSVDQLNKARKEAENSTQAKSILVSNMSHEIRTPLNALSGFSSLLVEEGLDDETRQQCNDVIMQNSELLLNLIHDVIDVSITDFHNMPLNIAEHDVIAICRNVVETVSKVKQTEAKVFFETKLDKAIIQTDSSRLQQVFINLLINATKFTPSGSITLMADRMGADDDTMYFTVTDTGCGIPIDKQGEIFHRFEKLHENIQGSGLGLSICKMIIENLGGSIWIDPGYTSGSRFCFTHPVCPPKRKEMKS